jgi:hypothetical protein
VYSHACILQLFLLLLCILHWARCSPAVNVNIYCCKTNHKYHAEQCNRWIFLFHEILSCELSSVCLCCLACMNLSFSWNIKIQTPHPACSRDCQRPRLLEESQELSQRWRCIKITARSDEGAAHLSSSCSIGQTWRTECLSWELVSAVW